MKVLLVSVSLLGFAAGAKADCLEVDFSTLKKVLEEKPAKNLVFFASWCIDCKKKIESASGSDVLIAVFETKDRADQLWKTFNHQRSRCYIDRDDSIAEAFRVKSLPFSVAGGRLP